MIKASKAADEAKQTLISNLSISEKQAIAILEMRLQRLTGLEQEKIKTEHSGLLELIERLKTILADESKILKIIKEELEQLQESYGDERRTAITEEEDAEIDVADLIK